MPKESLATVTRRRTLGVLLIVIAVSFVALSIAIYAKVFTKTVDVKLEANSLGNQLQKNSDVKERGIIVGSVKKVESDGQNATVTLALEPGRVKQIPRNVSAQILPKTLFGEQYVALFIPRNPAGPIKSGDVIPQDRSAGALEAQDVLGDLLPLLTDVQPAELNSTLTAIATALNGRGAKLGRALVNLDKYLRIMNPHTARLADDLGKLGQVADEYNGVSPDIFATLENVQTSVRTIVAKRRSLDDLLTTGTSTANVISGFLTDNRQRLIDVVGQTDKVYGLLAQYSPEFTCLLSGINNLANGAIDAVYDNQIHLNITVDNNNLGPYKQGQEPRLVTGYGPNCFGLPNNPTPKVNGNFQIPPKYRCLNDGAPLTADPCGASPAGGTTSSVTNTSIGSAQESALVDSLIAGELNTTPDKVPAVATILAAPLLRGHQVVVK